MIWHATALRFADSRKLIDRKVLKVVGIWIENGHAGNELRPHLERVAEVARRPRGPFRNAGRRNRLWFVPLTALSLSFALESAF